MSKRSVLFYRDFQRYSGGHQKVFDYFSHLDASDDYEPKVSFSETSQKISDNPWFPDYAGVEFSPKEYDYLFLAGMDWDVCRKESIDKKKPIINLIQHVRHAVQGENVHPFLGNRAIRICVSPEVETAIKRLANGPVVTIANGIHIPDIKCEKTHDVYIAGYKNPSLARSLSTDISAVVQTAHLSRHDFLKQLAATRIAVVLPHPTEGFFLPALEAICLADIAIIPDCIGNRSFCIDAVNEGGNCLMPAYNLEEITNAIRSAKMILSNQVRLQRIKDNGLSTVNHHSLAREREEFMRLMANVDELWHEG